MFERMLEGIPMHLGVRKDEWREHAAKADLVIYTGKIDEYFNYCCGRLPYRSLRFEHYQSEERLPHAVINQCNAKPYTRIYDHRYFSEEGSPSLPAKPQPLPPEDAMPLGAVPRDGRSEGAPSTLDKSEGAPSTWDKSEGALATIITKEYPMAHDLTNEPFYPMPFGAGMELYQKYKKLADAEPRTLFLGRLATYSYLDMWMAIKQAMVKMRPIIGKGVS
jgi:UDP-galactopyranose mutase